ncbi:MAG: hypothetical protein DRP94_01540 [Candidatus Latescibacterota bacterium]|nr:MAG: hypothetical protein DRP94_01540 [Candidatus Latescibacterota bacterium]
MERAARKVRDIVVQLLWENGPSTLEELADQIGVTKVGVFHQLRAEEERGLVTKFKEKRRGRGRRRNQYAINPAWGYAAGVDLGTAFWRVVGLDGGKRKVFERRGERDLGLSPKGTVELIGRVVREGGKEGKLLGVGIAFPGIWDREGRISMSRWEGWAGFPLRREMERRVGVPVFLIHNAQSMALGEGYLGEGRRFSHFLFLNLGTGVGLGVWEGGQVLWEGGSRSAEIGHMVMQEDGPPCMCGNFGCLEALASYRAIRREVEGLMSEGTVRPFEVTPRALKERVDSGDRAVQKVVERAGRWLGKALSYAVNLFHPEAVFVGGGMTELGEHLLRPMRETLREFALSDRAEVPVRISPLGEWAGALGAALYVWLKTL